MHDTHLRRLVQQYQRRSHLTEHLAFYQHLPTIESSIEYAALAMLPNGKRHPHQRRLQRQTLETVQQHLLDRKSQLAASESFEQILQLVRTCAVPGFGELARYDTALRLAVRLAHLPTHVYLHAGTRKGAATLGMNVAREYIPVAELPEPLHGLAAHEIEDFLCIYKAELAQPVMPNGPPPPVCTPRGEEPPKSGGSCRAVELGPPVCTHMLD